MNKNIITMAILMLSFPLPASTQEIFTGYRWATGMGYEIKDSQVNSLTKLNSINDYMSSNEKTELSGRVSINSRQINSNSNKFNSEERINYNYSSSTLKGDYSEESVTKTQGTINSVTRKRFINIETSAGVR